MTHFSHVVPHMPCLPGLWGYGLIDTAFHIFAF